MIRCQLLQQSSTECDKVNTHEEKQHVAEVAAATCAISYPVIITRDYTGYYWAGSMIEKEHCCIPDTDVGKILMPAAELLPCLETSLFQPGQSLGTLPPSLTAAAALS